jgi:hypothetical protein
MGWFRGAAALGFVVLSACSPEGSALPIGTVQLAVESAPLIGPALAVTEPAAANDARFWSNKAAAAWNGSAYLLVAQSNAWSEDEAGLFVADSVAWRLDSDANALDELPFGVPAAESVASNGADWLIAWAEPGGVLAARVSADGVVLDPTGFLVGIAGSADQVRVASDGQNYLVVWDDNGVLYGARVGPSGTVLGTTLIAAGGARFPVVAWAGTHYLVAYVALFGPNLATRVDSNGTVLDASAIVIGEGVRPEIASSGTESLIVRDGKYVYGTRVSADGTVLDPSPLNVAYGTSDPRSPKVTWDGTSYLVYTDSDCLSSSTILHRVTKSGAVSSLRDGACWPHSTNLAVAATGRGKHLRVYVDFEQLVRIIVASAPPRDWIAASARPQHHPRITANDSGALVAWREPYRKKTPPPSGIACALLASIDPAIRWIRRVCGSPQNWTCSTENGT